MKPTEENKIPESVLESTQKEGSDKTIKEPIPLFGPMQDFIFFLNLSVKMYRWMSSETQYTALLNALYHAKELIFDEVQSRRINCDVQIAAGAIGFSYGKYYKDYFFWINNGSNSRRDSSYDSTLPSPASDDAVQPEILKIWNSVYKRNNEEKYSFITFPDYEGQDKAVLKLFSDKNLYKRLAKEVKPYLSSNPDARRERSIELTKHLRHLKNQIESLDAWRYPEWHSVLLSTVQGELNKISRYASPVGDDKLNIFLIVKMTQFCGFNPSKNQDAFSQWVSDLTGVNKDTARDYTRRAGDAQLDYLWDTEKLKNKQLKQIRMLLDNWAISDGKTASKFKDSIPTPKEPVKTTESIDPTEK